jgi:hypothetical protein
MGWAKVAEVVLQSDVSELTLNFRVKVNYQYLILGEGKIQTGSSPYTTVRLLQNSDVLQEFGFSTQNINTTIPWFLNGLTVIGYGIGGGGYMTSGLTMLFVNIPEMSSDGYYDLRDYGFDLTIPITLKVTQSDGVLKAGLRVVVLEKPIE